MKKKNFFKNFAPVALAIATIINIAPLAAHSQNTLPAPKQERLLNGLKVLMWSDSGADKVFVKIRIHAGSAFDPQGKEGVMQVLADNIFPNEGLHEFFAEQLGGGLEVVTTYDYIQINASSKPESFLTMLETLASAVANPTIDKEVTVRLRNALLAKVKSLEADPTYVADQTVAKRLLGNFPYGRPQMGTSVSIQKIEFPDLIDAKERFLTADDATVTISGNFDRTLGFKAVRRLFGGWLKSDKKVPSTFRQPDEPSAGLLTIPSPKPDVAAIRFAFRGTSRRDPDFAASGVYSSIIETRLKMRIPAGHGSDVHVQNDAHILPGIVTIGFVIGKGDIGNGSGKIEGNDLMAKTLADPVTDAEFQSARSLLAAQWKGRGTELFWLDLDTFKTASADADRLAFDNLTLSDVRAYADRLRNAPFVSVLVNTAPAK